MSPLMISLVLRVHAQAIPNQDLPQGQAYAPAMVQAINFFKSVGVFSHLASPTSFYHGTIPRVEFLTPRGEQLVQKFLAVEL